MSLSSPWRADFPAMAAFTASRQTYLDNAATTQKPQALIDAISRCYSLGIANVHRARHHPAEHITRAFEGARQSVAHWFGVSDSRQIIFTHGSTEALNLLAYGLEQRVGPGDDIVISALEHHANLLPWQQLARRCNARLVVLPLDASGQVDLEEARWLIGPRTRILAISQLSNVLGCWLPLPELLAMARAQGALTLVDGAQGAAHGRHALPELGCDFYVCSAHKFYGPDGVGILYGRHKALQLLQPWQFGGEMVRHADYQSADFHPAPLGFEAGTPPIAGIVGLGATLDYLSRQDTRAIRQHEQNLHQQLLTGLQARRGVCLLGRPQAALASFTVNGVHPADLAQLLAEQGVAIRSGSHCAMPLMHQLGLEGGALRVSLGLYNDGQDLEQFFRALDQALELLA